MNYFIIVHLMKKELEEYNEEFILNKMGMSENQMFERAMILLWK